MILIGNQNLILINGILVKLGNNFTCHHLITHTNHNYNKIVKSDWLSTALISAILGQFNRTVRVMPK